MLCFSGVRGMMTLRLSCWLAGWLMGALQVAGGNWCAWQHPKPLVPRHRLAQPVSAIIAVLAPSQVDMPLCLLLMYDHACQLVCLLQHAFHVANVEPRTTGILACRNIAGTSVDPTLPEQCTAAGRLLVLDGIAAHRARQQQNKILIPVAAVAPPLLLAALVAGGAAGRVLWRRKLRQDSLHQQYGAYRLLRQHTCPSSEHAHATRALPVMAGGLGGAQRRAHLAAVLQSKPGCATSHNIEMLPLEAHPAPLAHRLGDSSRQSLVRTYDSWGSIPSSRQRILGTQSLQLAPGELEVGPFAT